MAVAPSMLRAGGMCREARTRNQELPVSGGPRNDADRAANSSGTAGRWPASALPTVGRPLSRGAGQPHVVNVLSGRLVLRPRLAPVA